MKWTWIRNCKIWKCLTSNLVGKLCRITDKDANFHKQSVEKAIIYFKETCVKYSTFSNTKTSTSRLHLKNLKFCYKNVKDIIKWIQGVRIFLQYVKQK